MKPSATAIFLLAATAATAQQPEWLDSFRSAGGEILRQLEGIRTGTDEQIAALGGENLAPVAEDADASMPPARDGFAVAVADGGIVFDRPNARLTYVGNVRVSESRMQLRCRNRLYLQFPASTLKAGEDKAKGLAQPGGTDLSAPAPAEPAGEPATSGRQTDPLTVSAYDAMVDAEGNNILLCSHGAQHIPHVKRGGNELTLEANADGSDVYLMADSKGDACIVSGKATLQWVDAQGRIGTLVAERGCIDFNREFNTIYIEGPTRLTLPDGTVVTGTESLCVTLQPTPGAEDTGSGEFLTQFTSMRFDGVASAEIRGGVCATRPAQEGQPAAALKGEVFSYNAQTGECSIMGSDCSLSYGGQYLHTKEGISLAPNGDITIHGKDISGTYTLPGEKPEDAGTTGTVHCGGEIRFNAEAGTVTFTGGLDAKDERNHISCEGPVVIRLLRTGEARKAGLGGGMINLAITEYGDIASVEATGAVDILYVDTAKDQALAIRGDSAAFNLEKGTARVSAGGGHTALLSYGLYSITTQAEGDSHMSVDEHGDIDVEGDTIHADLPFQQDHAVVDCSSHLKLERESGRMELGPGARLTYPGGLMTANGPISATLAPGEEDAKAPLPRYPHLSYNFKGVQMAGTENGGTLQTEKASMSCTGPIHVTIAPEGDGKAGDDALSRVQATAEGDVAILAKDSSGRLLRATGDSLVLDGASGTKTLTGSQVTLGDKDNTHTASGKGARVTVDRNNNARISGERQVTTATGLQNRVDNTKQNKH